MEINEKAWLERTRKLNGRIMFPTTHDILPEHTKIVIAYLKGWLECGNDILIVTKPHLDVIKDLCEAFVKCRDQITFRFTIGSIDDRVLKFWEPGAPAFEERFSSLVWAQERGFKTSVSCEPFLDSTILYLAEKLYPYVTDTIWIGLMNRIGDRVDTTDWTPKQMACLDEVKEWQKRQTVLDLYNYLCHLDKIRWKDSIRKMLNLPEIGDDNKT
jgi:DNA repair photolyase